VKDVAANNIFATPLTESAPGNGILSSIDTKIIDAVATMPVKLEP